MSPGLPIQIPTSIPNLYLRTPRPTAHDAQGLSKVFSHEYNSRFEPPRGGGPSDTSPAKYANRIPSWLEMAEKGDNCFCLIALTAQEKDSDDEIIGFGGINALSSKSKEESIASDDKLKVANVGVMLHEPFTGKGYGSAAMWATIDAAFGVFDADVVEAETLAVNEPFQGLMRKLKLDRFSRSREEEHGKEIVYRFTKKEWDSVNRT
jgi:RimJ/RimL family protein N-acetyltransferase